MGAATHRDDEVAAELAGMGLREKPDGPAGAAMLAAGVGVFVLGLLTTLSEASVSVHDWLQKWEWGQGVGPLAGKTTLTVIVWAATWLVLHLVMRRTNPNLRTIFWLSVVLAVLGVVGTFPTFFQAFASE